MSGLDLDRCAGVLVGLAVGDALGAGYEFESPGPERAEMVGGGLFGWEPGEWTDDTQMAICIAEEVATGALEPHAVGERFLRWLSNGATDVGNQTQAVLSHSRSATAMAEVAERYFLDHPRSAAGNGSLMRTGAVALAGLGSDESLVGLAAAISRLTHADPIAADACILWCVAIDRAVREGRLDGARDGVDLLEPDRREFWNDVIDAVSTSVPESFNPNGYVVAAFQAALASIWQTPVPTEQPCRHLVEALRRAVGIGHDTDTVAAIAGTLLGARWGATAVPARWKAIVHGWPGYRVPDLVRLGVLGARGGRPDSIEWPAAQDLSGYYSGRWPCEPIAVPMLEDPGVIMANLPGASGVDADVVVSLCRVGRNQVNASERVEVQLLDEDDAGRNSNLDFVFTDLAKAIGEWRDEDKTVLVHCVQAERRTPAIAAAYLAERTGLSGKEAFNAVTRTLPGTHMNRAFMDALMRLWPRHREVGVL